MAPKKAEGGGVITLETLDQIVEQLKSEEPAQHLEALMHLLKGTEESKEVRYAMVEKEVVQAVRPKMESDDPDVKLTAVRLIARYATFQGTMRKAACSTDSLLMLWHILEQYQSEMSAKQEYERKKEEEAAAAEAAAAAGGEREGSPSAGKKGAKDKGGKDKGGKKGKAEEEDGPKFNFPPAKLLEAVLRGVSTIVLKDAKATSRITGMSDMQPLITLMDHPVPLIQERVRTTVSTLMRSEDASTALYHAGLLHLLISQLEVPEVPRRLYALRILRKMASIPDSRLQALYSAGVVKVLTKMVAGIQPEGYVSAAAAPPKDAKAAKGKDKGKAAEPENPEDDQDQDVHKVQEAASELLAFLSLYLPEAADSVSNLNGPDMLRALLPEPVEDQLKKYGVPYPIPPELSPEVTEEAAEGEEEPEAAEEEPKAPLSKADSKKEAMKLMKSKAEREKERQEELERERQEEEAAEEAERLRLEAEEEKAEFEKANKKEMPTLKPNAPRVHAAVLQVIRAVLRNPEMRQRMSDHPWPQLFLHLLYHGEAPPPPPETPEEPAADTGKKGKGGKGDDKKGKDAKGAKGKDDKKGGKGSKPSTPEVEEPAVDLPKEWVDPPGPMYPPFEAEIRTASLECCAELLMDDAASRDEYGVSHIAQGAEMEWLGRLIEFLKEKKDPTNPLDVTLATRLALALGDIGLSLPEEVILKTRYTQLVKDMAALAETTECMHLKEAVGRASLVLVSDEHFTARPEPPPPSPPVTPPPDPLVTSKYLWDALGKPAMVDGFVVQNLPTQKA